MKYILIALLFSIAISSKATTYYVDADGGADAQTIAQANALNLLPGDSLLFQRGDTWRDAYFTIPSSGVGGNPVYYGAYGVGAKPRLFASQIASGWVNISGNIWASPAEFVDPYAGGYEGEVFFEANDSVTWGEHQTLFSGLTAEYDWFWAGDSIYVVASVDPSTAYSNVEVSKRNYCILLNDKEYIVIDSLDVRYSQVANIKEVWAYKDLNGLEIKNCYSSHTAIRGSGEGFGIESYHSNARIHHNEITECGRRGMSIYTLNATGGRMHNIVIENNKIYNCYHSGIDFASIQPAAIADSIVIRNNYVFESNLNAVPYLGMSHISAIGYNSGITMSNIYIYNNISVNSTSAALTLIRADSVEFYNNTIYSKSYRLTTGLMTFSLTTTSCIIKNNIVYSGFDADWEQTSNFTQRFNVSFGIVGEDFYTTMDVDNNLYFQEDSTLVYGANVTNHGGGFYWDVTKPRTWQLYRDTTGFDLNSIYPADPLFVDTMSVDYKTPNFTLQSESPAIGIAEPISFITTDYFGNPRSATNPTIGAVEYIADVQFGEPQVFSVDFPQLPTADNYWVEGYEIIGSDTLLIDSLTGLGNSDWVITFCADQLENIDSGYISAKSLCRINSQPITTLFANANYADTTFFEMANHELFSDSTEALSYRLKSIAHYDSGLSGQDSVDVNSAFKVPTIGDISVKQSGGDYTTIEAALLAASIGDIIDVYNGDYSNALTYSITDNVTIRAVGKSTLKSSSTAQVINITGGEGEVYIIGFEIDAEGSTYVMNATSKANVYNSSIYGAVNASLNLSNNTDTISNNVFTGNPIYFIYKHDVYVSENYFNGTPTYHMRSNVSGNKKYIYYNTFDIDQPVTAVHYWQNNGDYISKYNEYNLNNGWIYIYRIINLIGNNTIIGNKFNIMHADESAIILDGSTGESKLYAKNIFIYTIQASGGVCFDLRDLSNVLVTENLFISDKTVLYSYVKLTANNSTLKTNVICSYNSFFVSNELGYGFSCSNESTDPFANTYVNPTFIGNYIIGNGNFPSNKFHSVLVGFQNNPIFKYNYVENMGYGVVLKADTNVYTSENISYNIFKKCNIGFRIKGVSSADIYNNTLDSCNTAFTISNNEGIGVSVNTTLINNITNSCPEIINSFGVGTTITESNYNIFYNGTFNGTTFSTWKGLGYDANSYNTNPNFKSPTELWPIPPSNAIGNGEDLGVEYSQSLDTESVWPNNILYKSQMLPWTIGAYFVKKGGIITTFGSGIVLFKDQFGKTGVVTF